MQFLDTFWHKTLKRPYRLACAIDQGTGTSVVLLHGIGSSSAVWQYVAERLVLTPCRLIAFDLLGFGKSPKPVWPDYSVEDHAMTVIRMLERKRIKGPIILTGHSMGCLVAVHIARLRPQLVSRLVLYEMPLYAGLPKKRRYTLRRDLYFAIYKRIVQYPKYSPSNARTIQKMAARVVGVGITPETWAPFVKSLKNTIMQQTTLEDLKRVNIPTYAIYGALDAVVIRGNPRQVFAEAEHVHTQVITGRHKISARASTVIAKQIRTILSELEASRAG